MPKTVTIEFVLVGKNDSPITSEDVECMSAVAESIRLSARLVDMPCQDMHTSAFVQVNTKNMVGIYYILCILYIMYNYVLCILYYVLYIIYYLRNRKHVPCFYPVIELTRVEVWKNEKIAVGT